MNRWRRRQLLRGSLALTGLGLLTGCGARPPASSPAAQVPRIGYLANVPLPLLQEVREAFGQALGELGYVEGQKLVIEWRSGEGDRDRQRTFAAELVRLGVDIIVAGGQGDIRAAKEATDYPHRHG